MSDRVDVTLYTRSGCHLCEDAAAELAKLSARLPIAVTAVDVDADEAARARYNDAVPVIHVAGIEVSAAPLDWMAIRGAIDAVAAGLVEPADDDREPGTGFSH